MAFVLAVSNSNTHLYDAMIAETARVWIMVERGSGSAYVVLSAMPKTGVLAMTRSLAIEGGGRGIRVTAIAPGPFPTAGAWERLVPRQDVPREPEPRNPLGRPGNDASWLTSSCLLLSDRTAYINREVITIDSGARLNRRPVQFPRSTET